MPGIGRIDLVEGPMTVAKRYIFGFMARMGGKHGGKRLSFVSLEDQKMMKKMISVLLAFLSACALVFAEEPSPVVPAAWTGRPMKVMLSCSMPNSFYALLYSVSPGPTRTPYGDLHLGTPFHIVEVGNVDGNGKAQVVVGIPPLKFLAGAQIYFAAVYVGLNPLKVLFSWNVKVTISGPMLVISCPRAGRGGRTRPALVFADALSGTILNRIQTKVNPGEAASDIFGIKGFVGIGRDLAVIDLPGKRIKGRYNLGVKSDLTLLKPAPGNNAFWLLSPGRPSLPNKTPGEVVFFDGIKEQVVSRITLKSTVEHLVTTPVPKYAWVSTPRTMEVHLLDGWTGTVSRTIKVGRQGETTVYDISSPPGFLFVTTGDEYSSGKTPTKGTVTAISFPAGQVIGSIPVGPLPKFCVAVASRRGYRVMVSCVLSNSNYNRGVCVFSVSAFKLVGK